VKDPLLGLGIPLCVSIPLNEGALAVWALEDDGFVCQGTLPQNFVSSGSHFFQSVSK
jgi:hypothetical protein